MTGWTHEEAKQHTLIERLHERCSVYAQDFMPCPEQPDLRQSDWCERCLAADEINYLRGLVLHYEGSIDA